MTQSINHATLPGFALQKAWHQKCVWCSKLIFSNKMRTENTAC